MRYAARVDDNHREIVDGLRGIGRTVLDLSRLGSGAPDALVGNGVANVLIEIKTEKGKLQDKQKEFFKAWRGPKAVVRTLDEAIAATGLAC